jgi:hypothetical protein
MKELFIDSPPLPRYNFTWDVSVVFNLLRQWSPLHDLLKILTFKLVSLLALCTAARAQTLVSLSVDALNIQEHKVVFCCGDQ